MPRRPQRRQFPSEPTPLASETNATTAGACKSSEKSSTALPEKPRWGRPGPPLQSSPKQKPEYQPVCHEKRRHHDSGYIERSAERTRIDADADLALIDRV